MSCSERWNPSYKSNKEELWKCPFFLITASGFPLHASCVCDLYDTEWSVWFTGHVLEMFSVDEQWTFFAMPTCDQEQHWWWLFYGAKWPRLLWLTFLTSSGLYLAFRCLQMTFNLLIFSALCVCFCARVRACSCSQAEKWIWFAIGGVNACKSPASVSGE